MYLFLLAAFALDVAEDVFDGARDDASLIVGQAVLETLHRVGFASARLPVGEDGRVVALQR